MRRGGKIRENGRPLPCSLAGAAGAGRYDRPGMRIGCVSSVNREKAGELLGQCRAIAEASGLEELQFLRTPTPGHIRGPAGSTAEFLSADNRKRAMPVWIRLEHC